MEKLDLNGLWQMQQINGGEVLSAAIPGSVAGALLANGRLQHPYMGDNEKKILPVFEQDYVFTRSFQIEEGMLAHERIQIYCEGLDTLAELTLNGKALGKADNMHRTWVYDMKDLLKVGENTLSVLFHSPVKYMKEHPSPVGKGYTVLRKAACMFGWDWGLNLPDSGIWRDIYIKGFDAAKLSNLAVRQEHKEGTVNLVISAETEIWELGTEISIEILSPIGEVLWCQGKEAKEKLEFSCTIDNPKLWWPAGYGEQPLYKVQVSVKKDGRLLDQKQIKTGLRTVILNREEVVTGSKYQFIVNGKRIFYKGENLIIKDALLGNTKENDWEQLIDNCRQSNLNGIRVWGGAYYPPDVFYDLCDTHGLLVYQDFMFACSFYGLQEGFLENVEAELRDNLGRISHHPCIGLLCGNNEIDCIYTVAGSDEPETAALRKLFGSKKPSEEARAYVWELYAKLFLEVIPKICREYAPDISYVPSSPSVRKPGEANAFFDYLSDGDMHYYLQYNGNAPYQKMRSMHCRFMTEMGFQSYPSMKTIRAFTEEKDRSPYAPVMYSHQKCYKGNETIELYMERDYIVPAGMEEYTYLSQMQAGEIMKYSIEHFRRDNAYCSGVIMWQLNDCWPVVSWSGIDYYGRWKALQYYTKRFFAPVLLSALDEADAVALWVSNESPLTYTGRVQWKLRHKRGEVLQKGSCAVQVTSGSSIEAAKWNAADLPKGSSLQEVYLEYALSEEEKQYGTVLLKAPKEFAFDIPNIKLTIREEETAYIISTETDSYTKGLALDTMEGDCIFSDNWFDLSVGECREITVWKKNAKKIQSKEHLQRVMTATSLNHVMHSPRKQEAAQEN